MKIALCQINPTIGDIFGNKKRIVHEAKKAANQGAKIAVFPELALSGYPPKDLVLENHFLKDVQKELETLVEQLPEEMFVVLGFPEKSSNAKPYNSVAIIHQKKILSLIRKQLLPNYDVFDEARYFQQGSPSEPIEIEGKKIGITICEDLWGHAGSPMSEGGYVDNPVAHLLKSNIDVLINVSASPFNLAKFRARNPVLAMLSQKHKISTLFVNQVGGNDDLLFDGASAAFSPDGSQQAGLHFFKEDTQIVEIAGTASDSSPKMTLSENKVISLEEAALKALCMGVRDYVHKCGFKKVVLGLSGGLDSALTAAIATEALGPENVLGIALPTRFSSKGSLADAKALAENLGIELKTISIEPIFQTLTENLKTPLGVVEAGQDKDTSNLTLENIQPRIRCTVLMAAANQNQALLLNTGNKSEIAMGYCTLYGDMGGALSVIGDVYKTFAYKLAKAFNDQRGFDCIPQNTMDKPPSAELRPDQKDEDSLPPYEVLDPILEGFVEHQLSADDLIEQGYDKDTVLRVKKSLAIHEHKRRQLPPCLIVSQKAFSVGRRQPIAAKY